MIRQKTNNKLKTAIFTMLFILIILPAAAIAADYVSVSKDGIRIRSGPSTNDEILWEVFKDFPLKVIERQGQWLHTEDFEGDRGWIFDKLTSRKKTVIMKKKSVNMRVGPGTSYEVIASVKYGVVFTVIDKDKDWIKVKHQEGTTGWVRNDMVWPPDN